MIQYDIASFEYVFTIIDIFLFVTAKCIVV